MAYLAKRTCEFCGSEFKPKRASQQTCGRSVCRSAKLARVAEDARLLKKTRVPVSPYLQRENVATRALTRTPPALAKLRGLFNSWLVQTWERPGGLVIRMPAKFERALTEQSAVVRWRARPVAGGKPLSELERRALALEPVGLDREIAALARR